MVTSNTLTVQAIRDFAAALSDDGETIPHKRFWDLLEWQRWGNTHRRWRAYASQLQRAIGLDIVFAFGLTAP